MRRGHQTGGGGRAGCYKHTDTHTQVFMHIHTTTPFMSQRTLKKLKNYQMHTHTYTSKHVQAPEYKSRTHTHIDTQTFLLPYNFQVTAPLKGLFAHTTGKQSWTGARSTCSD